VSLANEVIKGLAMPGADHIVFPSVEKAAAIQI
jgi:hypothetical protein